MAKKYAGSLMLLAAAFIWGSAFVAQRSGMDAVGPFTYLAGRSVLTVLALAIPGILGYRRMEQSARRRTLLGGMVCGCALFLASALQQYGIQFTTAGKAGFLTALYIVFVPVLRRFGGKKAPVTVWLAVVLAAAGLYLLCGAAGLLTLNGGDAYLLACALVFSLHILVVDRFAPEVDAVALSWTQFSTCALLALAATALLETPTLAGLRAGWLTIAYAGLLSGAVAYTLQIVAQKRTDPAVASLLMSLESVFSVLCGWVVLHERLSPRELTGCALVFAAVLLAQRQPQKAA